MRLPRKTTGIAAGVVGGTLALALVTGLGPAPALSSTFAGSQQDDSTSSTSSTSTTSTTAGTAATRMPAPASRVIDAAGAGTVSVATSRGQLSLTNAVPNAGWRVEVEQSAGREVEVDFRRGMQRVQVNVELEDGAIRERVRFRDEATGTDIRTENGVVVRAEGPGFMDDDRSGTRGTGTSGPGDDGADHDVGDDHGGDSGNSGPGGGGTDDASGDDDGGGSGSSGDDSSGDGSSGSGSSGDDSSGDDSSGSGSSGDDSSGDDSSGSSGSGG